MAKLKRKLFGRPQADDTKISMTRGGLTLCLSGNGKYHPVLRLIIVLGGSLSLWFGIIGLL